MGETLSRTRKSTGTPAAVVTEPHVVASNDLASAATTERKQRVFLKIAIGGVLFWSLALAAMALFTANPLAVSRDQILRADAVITARRDKDRPDRLRIERVLSGGLTADDLVVVHNLPEDSPLAIGESCVVPLSHFRRDYVVTTLETQRAPPLIYHASPETIAEIRQILREAGE